MTRDLPAVGRARRTALADGRERWHLAADDARVAARLRALGHDGVGGFVGGGDAADDDADGRGGCWLERAPGAPTLAAWLADHPGPAPWRLALDLVRSLAAAAAACERAALFPGPIDPERVVVRDGRLELRADTLVAALVGGGAAAAPAPARTRWMAPELVDGAAADGASNRYAIGLVLYRLLAGEHPFARAGLRRGLADQAARGAPPLPAELAAMLPPGLQSTCLRLLDPDPAARPRTALELGRALDAITAAPTPPAPSPPAPATAPPPPPVTATARPAASPRSPSRWLHAAAIALPLALGLAAVVALAGRGTARGAAPRPIARDAPLARAATLADCASCHPRPASEWSRSVMAHATGSPLFQALEMLIEEQVGRGDDCPGGAGVLRAAGPGACTDPRTGRAVTGSGGALWCVNCHAPGANLAAALPPWNGTALDAATRRPLRDLLPRAAQEGISCAFCHQVTGATRPGAGYEGNPSWTSPTTGARFAMRPEDARGVFGIANSGYLLDPRALVGGAGATVAGAAHQATTPAARAYLRSSEFCGACHDVRLFGTDALEGVRRGEHFKRLRNAYSEWVAWADDERRAGRAPASCQDCHMSLYPGTCVPAPGAPRGDDLAARSCPPGTRFAAVPPGTYATGATTPGGARGRLHGHAFSGVDLPLDPAFDGRALDDATLDIDGAPVGARPRRDLLLARTFRLAIEGARRAGDRLELPIVVENVGAGHRVPAGFSQEREIWLHVRVTDAAGAVVYEAGRVDAAGDDLRDKRFLRITTTDTNVDARGLPLGLFGADVADGPEQPTWIGEPRADGGGRTFRGQGLVNFQNGFLRCVRCIGVIDGDGRCQPAPGQERARADRYADGDYDPDTGACGSNLRGDRAFVEVYFPIGALDASRGTVRGPDAIVDTRSLPPGVPQRFVHDLDLGRARGPLTIEVRLRFRAFPPYLLRAFVDYERAQAQLGRRPSGPLIDARALDRLDIVDVAAARLVLP